MACAPPWPLFDYRRLRDPIHDAERGNQIPVLIGGRCRPLVWCPLGATDLVYFGRTPVHSRPLLESGKPLRLRRFQQIGERRRHVSHLPLRWFKSLFPLS